MSAIASAWSRLSVGGLRAWIGAAVSAGSALAKRRNALPVRDQVHLGQGQPVRLLGGGRFFGLEKCLHRFAKLAGVLP